MAEDLRDRRGRLVVEVGTELKKWYQTQSKSESIDTPELVRRVLSEYQAKAAKGPTRARDAKRRFLDQLEREWGIWSAAKSAKVDAAEVRDWLQDPEFSLEVMRHQQIYIEGVEQHMLSMARGTAKGCFASAIGFLNSHHVNYGRVKGEFLAKFLAPLLNRLHKIAVEKVGENNAKELMLAFQAEADARLAQFTV